MEKCRRFVANNLSENGVDDSSESDSDQNCDKPIDLKQTYKCDQMNATNDSVLSKLVRSKAFSIKDILGLDESDKNVEGARMGKERNANSQRFFTSESASVSPSVMIDSSRWFVNTFRHTEKAKIVAIVIDNNKIVSIIIIRSPITCARLFECTSDNNTRTYAIN